MSPTAVCPGAPIYPCLDLLEHTGKKTPKAAHPPKNRKAGEEQMGVSSPAAQSVTGAEGGRVETYFVFQQVIKGFMVWWVWSIVRASRSQWRAQSWRKRGSLQRQREEAQ